MPGSSPLTDVRPLTRAGAWEKALELLDGVDPDHPEYADACVEGARLARLLGRIEEAKARIAGVPLTPRRLRFQATLAMDDSRLPRAAELLAQAEALGPLDRDELARIRLDLADLAAYRGALRQAQAGFEEVLDWIATLTDPTLEVDAYNGLGSSFRYGGRVVEAESAHRRALSLAQSLDYPLGAHTAMRGLGGVALAKGDAQFLREVSWAGREIALQLNFRDGMTWCDNSLGEAARLLGEMDEAERWYRRALEERVVGSRRVAIAINLSLIAAYRGEFAEARVLTESELYADPEPGPGWRALLHGTLLGPCEALGDVEAWAHHHARAVALLAETGEVESDLATSLSQAGAISESRGSLARAARSRALALAQWNGLGRSEEAAAELRALGRLAALGAPIPLGPFDLSAPLGAGARGTVWAARHATLGHRVAIKVLHAGGSHTAAAISAFRAEVRAVVALDHPHIVPVLDHGRVDAAAARMSGGQLTEGSPFLVMALAEGGTLRARIGQLGWAECRRVLLELLDALGHAHARGVIHRDLKPANVLLGPEGRVWLSDFGLSYLSEVGDRAAIAGTPRTMAPEQFVAGASHGPPTDLYALGCIAFLLVSGRWPFEGMGVDALREAHLYQPPPVLHPTIDVPVGFDHFVRRLLAKRPVDRYPHAAAARRVLIGLGDPVPDQEVSEYASGEPFEGPGGEDWGPSPTLVPDDLGEAHTFAFAGDAPGGPTPASAMSGSGTPDAMGVAQEAKVDLPDRFVLPMTSVPLSEPEERGWTPGAGLGLMGIRRPPLVGRETERSLLWSALGEVCQRGSPLTVVLVGQPGVGRTRLLEWLAEKVAELGVAQRCAHPMRVEVPSLCLADADHFTEGIAEGPILCVRLGEVAEGERHIVVPPLDEAAMHRLAAEGLGLDSRLCAALVPPAAGRPQWLVQVVRTELERGHLVVGEGAFTARGGLLPTIPPNLEAVWQARLESLVHGSGGEALVLAAAQGTRVNLRQWREAVEAAGLVFPEELLDRLLDAGLAVREPSGWRFCSQSAWEVAAGGGFMR